MASVKIKRIASQIAKEISNIISFESRDENFRNVTITGAEVTNDLSFATIYFTAIDEENKEVIQRELNNAAGFFRKEISERVDIRYTPEIKFKYDDSIEYGNNIERILKEIHKEDNE